MFTCGENRDRNTRLGEIHGSRPGKRPAYRPRAPLRAPHVNCRNHHRNPLGDYLQQPSTPGNSHPPQEGSVFTQGTVVDHDIAPKGICSPIAELVVDGVAYRSDPGVGAEPCEHEIGDPIEVAYHPDDISGTLQIPHDEKETRQVIVISLPGWGLLIGSTISLVNNIRYRRKAKQAQA